MKKAAALFVIIVCIGGFFILYVSGEKTVLEQKFNYFPEDQSIDFVQYDTNLSWKDRLDEDEYTIKWSTGSKLDRSAYLRQDISLLYEDGLLIDKVFKWGDHTKQLQLEKTINREDSGHFQAISVHHAEIHYPDDTITSRQQMSYDQLYVTASPFSPMEAFEIPQNEEEKEWQRILNHATKQQLHYVWKDLLRDYQLSPKNYYRFSLPYLHIYNRNNLPGMTKKQTEKAIGKLWERLYDDYFLGIETEDGEIINPIGSTIPLILLDKKGERLIVLTKAANGENVKLVQTFSH
ncbi:MAG TPA: hypothetical protein VFT51_11120 [Bacillales bacterium]|nr:hypothetical protein [Bacillales bacterium]